jgi:phage-related protein (TIGR01555 family)|nr:MAG TPA: Portal [Caudoviricetes sp.]
MAVRRPKRELEKERDVARGRQVLRETQGKAVRPYRGDGYTNVLNKYGTTQDNSEAYRYEREPIIPDMKLTSLYEGNGLFSKIIDTPAEEALKHGFNLNLNSDELDNFVEECLDELEWEEKAATAIKWARLYGGSIIVMLIDDGRGLEEPVDWQNIKSIDELRVFERAVVQPDYASLYMQDYGGKGNVNRTSKFGEPEFYYVTSMYGSFMVHESRCLVFRNGVLPEQVSNTTYQMWGMPEYIRIKRALRETVTAHTDATKLLERSVQAIYSMKNLASLLATDDGEDQVVRRLEVIDMARGLLNSIAIDADGENYDFKSISFSGVKDVIDSTCNMLSALTNIPQTLLFGRSPAGENATGASDLENYYNFVERIQKLMLKRNLRYLLDVVFRAGVASGEIDEEPDYKLVFNPLWSLSDAEQATVEQTKASASLTKAQTAQIYVDMQALDPSEVRRKLASDDEFTVEEIIDEEDEDLYSAMVEAQNGQVESEVEAAEANAEQQELPGGSEQSAPNEAPAATEVAADEDEKSDAAIPTAVGVLVLRDGKVLTGVRKSEFYPFTIGGPGGHIEKGETPEQAAVRETQEEFGITPTELIPLTVRTGLAEEFGVPEYFLCTQYDGEIDCADHSEVVAPQMSDLCEVLKAVSDERESLFAPFADSIRVLNDILSQEQESIQDSKEDSDTALPFSEDNTIIESSGDGGPGSGRYPKGSGAEKPSTKVSATGANDPCKGFGSKAKLKTHVKKHGAEVGAKSDAEYEKKAVNFLKQPCGGDIDGYSTADGKVVRFNRKTTEYAAGYPGGSVTTYMLAKFNKKTGQPNVELANTYFDNCKKEGR